MFQISPERLLQAKSQLVRTNSQDQRQFLRYCAQGNVEGVKQLMKEDQGIANVPIDQKGNYALHVAAENGRYGLMKFLIQQEKVDTNTKNQEGNTPLFLACQVSIMRNKQKYIDLILNSGVDITESCNGMLLYELSYFYANQYKEILVHNNIVDLTVAKLKESKILYFRIMKKQKISCQDILKVE